MAKNSLGVVKLPELVVNSAISNGITHRPGAYGAKEKRHNIKDDAINTQIEGSILRVVEQWLICQRKAHGNC